MVQLAESDGPTAFDAFSAMCPSQSVLRDLTGRWVPLVMIALDDGSTRFGEIHRRIGGSNERMIAQTLRMLEVDGFVERAMDEGRPAYRLTEGGRQVTARYRDLIEALYSHLAVQDTGSEMTRGSAESSSQQVGHPGSVKHPARSRR
ncbi:helix-turn-helix transcriptional regulator [Acaricomes phytoseiuli]|uniref:winged helix-turn-helix transcriptional regulator n=1 Tax=Acaricomes phytoseiuli TaxID=291968 RepID=UPI0003999388|nr:helix-turn-helix domain-containing protein [Acaricomes phytoseiuli]MCW1249881.1 helix-turn-helix transcriptional regulator [Acaricomes phytoseiuli]